MPRSFGSARWFPKDTEAVAVDLRLAHIYVPGHQHADRFPALLLQVLKGSSDVVLREPTTDTNPRPPRPRDTADPAPDSFPARDQQNLDRPRASTPPGQPRAHPSATGPGTPPVLSQPEPGIEAVLDHLQIRAFRAIQGPAEGDLPGSSQQWCRSWLYCPLSTNWVTCWRERVGIMGRDRLA